MPLVHAAEFRLCSATIAQQIYSESMTLVAGFVVVLHAPQNKHILFGITFPMNWLHSLPPNK
jgi:hypothetical protein